MSETTGDGPAQDGPASMPRDESRGAAPTRHRGGQPGNQNARQHGFYSRFLSPDDQLALEEAAQLRDLLPELALMRVKLQWLANRPDCSPQLIVQAIRTVARLLDVHRRLTASAAPGRSGGPDRL